MRKGTAALSLLGLLLGSLVLPAGAQKLPGFKVSPGDVWVGEILKIRGSAWYGAPPECERKVVLDVLNFNQKVVARIGTVAIKSDHTFRFNWRVKGLRANRGYKVQARQPCYDSSGNPMLNATSAEFRVVKPYLEYPEYRIGAGDTERFRGTDWNPRSICNQKVKLIARKDGEQAVPIGVAQLNDRAAFSHSWTVPEGMAPGPWKLKAVQSCRQAGKPFKITAAGKLQLAEPPQPPPEEPGDPG